MKAAQITLVLVWCWLVGSVQAGELLGRISDETATVETSQPALVGSSPINYRVICPAGGEILPECQLPVVQDTLQTGGQQSNAVDAEPLKTTGGTMKNSR